MQDAKHRGDTPADVVPDDEIGPARPVRGPAPAGDAAARADTRPPGAPGEPPPMPHKVGGYTVLEPLGTGGMGHVYLARQESLDRLVALKVLRNELARDKGYLERFQREAKAAALFQHPHVVAVIDTGHDPAADLHYIAFEFVDGGSLEGIVRAQGALPERRALEVTRAVALALQFAEARRLIHRDLKPANILVGSDGSVKLADLGLVRQAERVGPQVTQEGIILGTPLYMAPEQALGRDIDIRADIYALGLCLYRMLTGRTPFNERDDTCSTLAILSRHVNEELPDVRASTPGASEGVVRLLADMTAREAERRYRSAVHVVTDIDRVLAGQPPLGARAQQVDLESEAPTTAVNAVTVAALREQTAPPAPGPQDAPTVAGPPAPPPPKPVPPPRPPSLCPARRRRPPARAGGSRRGRRGARRAGSPPTPRRPPPAGSGSLASRRSRRPRWSTGRRPRRRRPGPSS
ncbi:MAG: serine/threonine protein kinase [Planctomycetes bacterium]|nr:serine/threonine protein kinase [Planctomycetota bacterium]